MDLGQRIHQLRIARGLTQRELAEPGYTAAYVSSVESGRRTPSGEALRYFAERLGVSSDELTGQPEPTKLDLAFVTALSTGEGFEALAETARRHGENRWQAWALLELDPRAHLETATALLAGETPLDRIPLVLALSAQSETRYAIYVLERARDELSRSGFPDPDARHAVHAHLAARYLELGDEDRAAVAAEEALSLAFQGDPSTMALDHLTTARALVSSRLSSRRRSDAAIALGQALSCYRRAALTPQLAACYRARGWRLRDNGDLASAALDLARARALYGETDPALDVAVELAEVLRMRGLASQAEELISFALTFPGTPLRLAHARRELGLLALDRGDAAEAECLLREALALYEKSGPARELARTLRALSDLLYSQGRLPEAAELLRAGLLLLLSR